MKMSNKVKNSYLALGAIALFLVAIVYAVQAGYISVPEGGIVPPVTTPTPGPTQTAPSNDMVSVTKQLKIVATDKFAGGAPSGTTNAIVVYDSDGKTILETCTLSSGSCTTANSYQSGKIIYIKYYYDTTIDEYKWDKVTVPKMGAADAESLTTNTINMKTFSTPAATDTLISGAGTTYADSSSLYATSLPTGTLTYQWYVTADNKGYITCTDPIYNLVLKPMVWATLTGTGYETVSLSGFEGAFQKGSTMYYYKTVSDTDVTKYKVGNDYVYSGAGSFTFSYNAVGYTAANTTTLQLYTKLYANEGYMQQYGSYGPYAFTLTEQTVTVCNV